MGSEAVLPMTTIFVPFQVQLVYKSTMGRTCTLTGYVIRKIRTLSRALQSSRVLGSKFMICLGLGNMYSWHVWYLPWIHTWHLNKWGISHIAKY